jgi:hypothetical protein
MVAALERGVDVTIPDITQGRGYRDPVADRLLDKLGLLPGNLPERVVRFYSVLGGIRLDLIRIGEGEFDTPRTIAALKEDLALWADNVALGKALVEELKDLARGIIWATR